MTISSVDDLIKFHEEFTDVAKPDAKGKWEIGYGFDGAEPGDTMTLAEADAKFPALRDLAAQRAMMDLGVGAWSALDTVRRAVLIDMAYEIGGAGLADFVKFLSAVRAHDWPDAAEQLVDSKLYAQVPTREQMNRSMLLAGTWPQV